MGEMTIRHMDDSLMHDLNAAASRVGADPSHLVQDIIAYFLASGPRAGETERVMSDAFSSAQRESRASLLAQLRSTREMTLQPLVFDSTLLIREIRDADG